METPSWVKDNHRRDFHPLANHMTKLNSFNKGEICEFSAFPFSLQLMFHQIADCLNVCLLRWVAVV